MNRKNYHRATKKYISDLNKIDLQRKFWLRISFFVVIAVVGVIYGWDNISNQWIKWILVSFSSTVSVVWWYWTMRLIRLNITQRKAEAREVERTINELHDAIDDFKDITKNYR